MGLETAAAITAAAAVAGAGATVYGTVKQNEEAQKSRKSQEQINALKTAREKRQQVREARIKQAAIIQAGANQGATTSSAVQGGASSISSQLGANLSFLDKVGSLQQNELKHTGRAQTYGSVAQLGSTIFSNADVIGAAGAKAKLNWDVGSSIKNNPDIF